MDDAGAGDRVDAGRMIVEGFIDVDYEVTLLTARAERGRPTANALLRTGRPQAVHRGYVESWQPQPQAQRMTPGALAAAKDIAEKVMSNLGGLGVFGVELFVKGDMVWFSEVSPRPHDTGMVTMATQCRANSSCTPRRSWGCP